MEKLKEKAYAYGLKSALAHEGKCVQGALISGLFAEGLKKEELGKHMRDVTELVKKINSLSIEEQQKEFEKLKDDVGERETRQGLPELPNVPKTGIITRFAPAPSGPLHLGHVISNMYASLYVKKYGGKFYVRIEDTNPEKILKKSYTEIQKDCDWLFGNVTEYIIQSDRMEIYYNYAEKLIKLGKAYVCTCSQEEFKEFSKNGKDCPCRSFGADENSARWKKMFDKKGFKEGGAVLRFRTIEGMQHPNPAMRDFPLARINQKKHVRQGNKYRVWPLMNLSVSVDDLEYGMTHVIRGKDHMDNAKRQKMVFEALGKVANVPWTFFIGRFKFTDVDLSKRKITKAIEDGKYSGWDDEKLPTIASLRKRGYKPEAFEKFAVHRGLSDVDKVIDSKEIFRLLDEFNK